MFRIYKRPLEESEGGFSIKLDSYAHPDTARLIAYQLSRVDVRFIYLVVEDKPPYRVSYSTRDVPAL